MSDDPVHVKFTRSEMDVEIVDGVQLYPPTGRIDAAELNEQANGADAGRARLVFEVRRLQRLLARVTLLHADESLSSLAARYGVECAQHWREVLDEAAAIRAEQEQGA